MGVVKTGAAVLAGACVIYAVTSLLYIFLWQHSDVVHSVGSTLGRRLYFLEFKEKPSWREGA
jgi:hypothetical protein